MLREGETESCGRHSSPEFSASTFQFFLLHPSLSFWSPPEQVWVQHLPPGDRETPDGAT